MTRFPKITETFILREIRALEQLGWRVDVFALIRERESVPHPGVAEVTARAHFGGAKKLQPLGAMMAELARHPLRSSRLLLRTVRHLWRTPGFLIRALASFPVAVSWAHIARESGARHIHAHFATHAAYIAYSMSELSGIPYSFTAHAHDIYQERAMLEEKIRAAQFVVTISEYNRALLARLYPQAAAKILVVRGGVDLQAFRPRDADAVRADAGALRILATGRLQEYKGMPYLVEACRQVKALGIPFQCDIIGDGPQRPALEAAILRHELAPCVHLLGWLPSPEVGQRLLEADVFVLPSVVAADGMMEGLPVALMEAMSCGVAVVSTLISGIPELVRDGRNGLLVPPRDATALASALVRLYHEPAMRARMGREGRATIERDFDLDHNTRRKAALFAQALAREDAAPRP
ncbi:MAG: glycosyltransferase [Ktedonobacterales bacterium]|nr:glycosyltransferase [Ktedonobacterales bacterium]